MGGPTQAFAPSRSWVESNAFCERRKCNLLVSPVISALVSNLVAVYSSFVSTISVSKLKKRPAHQWRKVARKDELVVTSQGKPVAVLLPIDVDSLDGTLSTLRSVRALHAQAALQRAAKENGTASLTVKEIESEIRAARNERRRK
jgi:prevent-host-death family protein